MSSTATAIEINHNNLGNSVPPFTSHAISVSLPTWRDNVGYEEGDKRVIDSMETGYPRFFIHKSIQKLARICERKFGRHGELSMLFPTLQVADCCRSFVLNHPSFNSDFGSVRLVRYALCPDEMDVSTRCTELHVVFFVKDDFNLAKQFWQHTGLGISSRFAERFITLLSNSITDSQKISLSTSANALAGHKRKNHHYSTSCIDVSTIHELNGKENSQLPATEHETENWVTECDVYVEERYGRNMPISSASEAKRALRRRIAGVLVHDGQRCAGGFDIELGPSSRGVKILFEEDVYLFPTGMSAVWKAHQIALNILPHRKSVCFGFPYTDTLKILEKWGPGCYFFGHGLDSDIESLETLLGELSSSGETSPILALFCEFPSNPLLRSPNLPKLRALADKYGFPIIIDETIGNFVNVAVLPYADIVVSSLTKVFSGDSNVMGGSLVINPQSFHFKALKATMECTFEDTYFDEDAIFMERNSRNFEKRVRTINRNAEAVCDLLYSESLVSGNADALVKEVFYPKWTTRQNFDFCRHPDVPLDVPYFGGLFSVTFTSDKASQLFFDALRCHKGPSLGTNFTLACPYTILAHYGELDWAKSHGVEEGLVRVSVGLEDQQELSTIFKIALEAANASLRT